MIELAVGIYAIFTIFFAGIGIGTEASFSNPKYGEVIIYAVLWPVTLMLASTVYLDDKYS